MVRVWKEGPALLLLLLPIRPGTTDCCPLCAALQATPLVAGVGVAAAAFLSREIVKQYIKFQAAPAAARAYYKVCGVHQTADAPAF
jgi:hypothetical protein